MTEDMNATRFLEATDEMLTMLIDIAKLLDDKELEFDVLSMRRRLVIHFGDVFRRGRHHEKGGDITPRERTDH